MDNKKAIKLLPALLLVLLITIWLLRDYQKKQYTVTKVSTSKVSGATGELFSGEPVRKISPSLHLEPLNKEYTILGDEAIQCSRWAVLTTINDASTAVHRQVMLSGWCLVIIADRKTPSGHYETGWVEDGKGNAHVVYLTVEDQENFDNEFARRLPWNHFGRKNIGYLYAIQHGAVVIWDFDDDNILKHTEIQPGKMHIEVEIGKGLGEETVDVRIPHEHTYPTFNPYPILGAPTIPSWPRGLPLKDIKEPQSFNISLSEAKIPRSSMAVLQSLADQQPDVDAIFRLTMKIPFSFKQSDEAKPLVVPRGVLTPYNAQATLHFKKSFWGLFLPVTVNGRVSDIWRSYIAQRLFWDCGLSLAFSARPLVIQDRNFHDYIRDLAAEEDLYLKAAQLIEFLHKWKSNSYNLEERMLQLYTDLYEREYIEEEDVLFMQQWLSNLKNSGFVFPNLLSS